jgi:hypothetical protein
LVRERRKQTGNNWMKRYHDWWKIRELCLKQPVSWCRLTLAEGEPYFKSLIEVWLSFCSTLWVRTSVLAGHLWGEEQEFRRSLQISVLRNIMGKSLFHF